MKSFQCVYDFRKKLNKNIIFTLPNIQPKIEVTEKDIVLNLKADPDGKYTREEVIDSYKEACEYIDAMDDNNETIGLINLTGYCGVSLQFIYAYYLYKTKGVIKSRELLFEHYEFPINKFCPLFLHFLLVPLENAFCQQ